MKNSTILFILFCFFVSSVFAQLTVKDQEPTPNILMQVHDEGTAGSIWLGPISEYLDDSKLYNNGGNLFWGTDQLGLAGNAGGWTDNGTIICNTTLTDKVGIGINPPTANLHVSGDDGVLFTGTYDVGIIPIEGAGTRMMWYPKKAAFRVGYVNDTKWDDANIGSISTAIGTNTTASGNISTAMGQRTTASGNTSTAMGYNTTASGFTSTTMGESTTASGEGSTAMGYYTTANSRSSLVIGMDPQYLIGSKQILYSRLGMEQVQVIKVMLLRY